MIQPIQIGRMARMRLAEHFIGGLLVEHKLAVHLVEIGEAAHLPIIYLTVVLIVAT
jgi:hypothetical protein